MQRARVGGDCGADGPLRLVQQPSYDCRSAYGEDEELEHCGEAAIRAKLLTITYSTVATHQIVNT